MSEISVPSEVYQGKTCQGCHHSCNSPSLSRLGIRAGTWDYIIALAGNPNTGKSTIFNALTGLRQHVGNWPGKTVTRAEGGFRFKGHSYKLVDLPGTYSLLSNSVDEEVARDFLLFGRPDVSVVVADATCLERNLHLALQILEITDRVVLALNLMDEAKRKNLRVDARSLARDMGIPVVPMAARRGEGVNELLEAMDQVATGEFRAKTRSFQTLSPTLEKAVNELVEQIHQIFPDLPNARWVALRLLEGDESVLRALHDGEMAHLNEQPTLFPIIDAKAPA